LAIKTLRYETQLLILLSLANGVVALDRLTASFLSPYLVADLGLNNTQLGLMSAALSIAVAASSVLLGRVADRTGRRRLILLSATVLFSLFSGLSGVAAGFGALLLARLLLGAAEGPMVPLSQAIMAEESHPSRRGFNMGVMQMAGAFLIGGMAGPVIATTVADAYGWRAAFFLSALPGLTLALGLFFVMRPDPPRPARREGDAPAVPLGAALRTLLGGRAVFWVTPKTTAQLGVRAGFALLRPELTVAPGLMLIVALAAGSPLFAAAAAGPLLLALAFSVPMLRIRAPRRAQLLQNGAERVVSAPKAARGVRIGGVVHGRSRRPVPATAGVGPRA